MENKSKHDNDEKQLKGDQMKEKMMSKLKMTVMILGIMGILLVSSCSKETSKAPVQPIIQDQPPQAAEEQKAPEKTQGPANVAKTEVTSKSNEEIQDLPLDDLDKLNIDEVDALDDGLADAEELVSTTVE